MKLGLVLGLILAATMQTVSGADLPDNDLIYDKFVMFGDSITEISSNVTAGFCIFPDIVNSYIRKLDVVARGFSGYNTHQARGLINKVIDAGTRDGSKIRLMTVFFGSNDAQQVDPLHVPLDEYTENTAYIVQQAKNSGIDVIVVGPGLINEELWGDITSTKIFKQYSDAAKRVAKHLDVGFVDLRAAFLNELGWKEGDPMPGESGSGSTLPLMDYLRDGLHFTEKGYHVYTNALYDAIQAKFPDDMPDKLEYLVPVEDY